MREQAGRREGGRAGANVVGMGLAGITGRLRGRRCALCWRRRRSTPPVSSQDTGAGPPGQLAARSIWGVVPNAPPAQGGPASRARFAGPPWRSPTRALGPLPGGRWPQQVGLVRHNKYRIATSPRTRPAALPPDRGRRPAHPAAGWRSFADLRVGEPVTALPAAPVPRSRPPPAGSPERARPPTRSWRPRRAAGGNRSAVLFDGFGNLIGLAAAVADCGRLVLAVPVDARAAPALANRDLGACGRPVGRTDAHAARAAHAGSPLSWLSLGEGDSPTSTGNSTRHRHGRGGQRTVAGRCGWRRGRRTRTSQATASAPAAVRTRSSAVDRRHPPVASQRQHQHAHLVRAHPAQARTRLARGRSGRRGRGRHERGLGCGGPTMAIGAEGEAIAAAAVARTWSRARSHWPVRGPERPALLHAGGVNWAGGFRGQHDAPAQHAVDQLHAWCGGGPQRRRRRLSKRQTTRPSMS